MSNQKRLIVLLMTILLLTSIFLFSHQNAQGSKGLSKSISTRIASFICNSNNVEKDIVDYIEHVIRKCAHFSLYFILGVLIFNFVNTYGISTSKSLIVSQFIGAFYAVFGEFHQLFVNGRTAKITDVFIDSIGFLIGILIVLVIRYRFFSVSCGQSRKI